MHIQAFMDPDNIRDQDDDLYKPMIWALVIGIIVVVVTLFLTRPEPESFSELYFLNHTTLPEYIDLNNTYQYDFMIHSLENKQHLYNITINAELYSFDLSCERPDLWLEEKGNLRVTETEDPALYIKEQEYGISFNYQLIKGDYVTFKLLDLNNEQIYSISINHKTKKITFNNGLKIYEWNISTNKTAHKFSMNIDKEFTKINLDGEEIFFLTDYNYTNGFPFFEIEYAEVSNFQILRRAAKQNVNIRIADSVYKEERLVKEYDKGVVILYSRFLASYLYDKVVNQPIVRTATVDDSLTYYYSENPVNLTDYTVKVNFRTYGDARIETGFEKQLDISYSQGIIKIRDETINVTQTSYSEIAITVSDRIEVFFNNQKVAEYRGEIVSKPYIKAYGNAIIRDFTSKSNIAPETIKYTFPDKQVVTYSGLFTPSVIQSVKEYETPSNTTSNNTIPSRISKEDAISRIQDLYDREKITWKNYRITAAYLDKNKTNEFIVTYLSLDDTIYSIAITNDTAKINFKNQSKEFPITTYSINRLSIEVINDTAEFYINDQFLTKEKLAANEGFVTFNYPNITLISAQVENRDINTIKIFKKQTNVECNPILINTETFHDTKSLEHDQKLLYNAFFRMHEPFDIAKVQVTLQNGQEIHFWVKQK